MTRVRSSNIVLAAFMGVYVFSGSVVIGAKDRTIRDIRGGTRQLFVDDWIIAETANVSRQQGEPVKRADNPILKRDKPWDAARCDLYGSSVYDPQNKRIQLFYAANSVPNGHEDRLAYAESCDGGRSWIKPEFDLIPFKDHRRTNLVMLPPSQTMHGPCVFRDDHDTDPAKRYKLFTSSYPDTAYLKLPRCYEYRGQFIYATENPALPPGCSLPGMYVAYSPDGVHWNTPPLRISNMMSDTAQCAFWDARLQKYVAYVRARTQNDRSVARMESDDFEHWTEPVVVLEGTRDQSLYSMGVNPYQGIYIGTPWIFAPGSDPIGKPVIWPELAVSRDGISWARPFPGQPFVPCGPPGSADSRQIRMASSFVVLDDRIILLYGQADRPHSTVDMQIDVGMATLRLDGFAAMTAGDTEGSVLTHPLQFKAGRLHFNAKVESGGHLRAELLDREGKTLAGYDAASCLGVQGDTLHTPLTWKGQGSLPSSDNGEYRIRILLKNAKLYSVWIENP